MIKKTIEFYHFEDFEEKPLGTDADLQSPDRQIRVRTAVNPNDKSGVILTYEGPEFSDDVITWLLTWRINGEIIERLLFEKPGADFPDGDKVAIIKDRNRMDLLLAHVHPAKPLWSDSLYERLIALKEKGNYPCVVGLEKFEWWGYSDFAGKSIDDGIGILEDRIKALKAEKAKHQ